MAAKKLSSAESYRRTALFPAAQRKADIAKLNKLSVPIADVRLYLASLSTAGITEIPLGTLWLEVNRIYNEST